MSIMACFVSGPQLFHIIKGLWSEFAQIFTMLRQCVLHSSQTPNNKVKAKLHIICIFFVQRKTQKVAIVEIQVKI